MFASSSPRRAPARNRGPVPGSHRHDLWSSTADGVAFSFMVGIGECYLAAFALALGKGGVVAGLTASLPFISGAILQLVTPHAVRRLGSQRSWVVLCSSVQALCFLPLTVAAWSGAMSTPALFLVASIYWGSGLAAGPAWNTWIETLVPGRIRARYFAGRTRLTQVGSFLGLLTGSLILHRAAGSPGAVQAFALLFLAAGVARGISVWFLSRHGEPIPLPPAAREVPLNELARRTGWRGDQHLLLYLLAIQTSVYVAAPYFTPYMLGPLGLSVLEYMVLIGAAYLSKMLALPALGRLAAAMGSRRLLAFGGLAIIPMSLLWLVSDAFGYLLMLQIGAGIAWGAYELGTSLSFFDTIRDQERTSILTTYNLVNALAMVLGSTAGALLLSGCGEDRTGYHALFALSFLGRLACLPLLLGFPELAPLRVVRSRLVHLSLRVVAVRPDPAGSLSQPLPIHRRDEPVVRPARAAR